MKEPNTLSKLDQLRNKLNAAETKFYHLYNNEKLVFKLNAQQVLVKLLRPENCLSLLKKLGVAELNIDALVNYFFNNDYDSEIQAVLSKAHQEQIRLS